MDEQTLIDSFILSSVMARVTSRFTYLCIKIKHILVFFIVSEMQAAGEI